MSLVLSQDAGNVVLQSVAGLIDMAGPSGRIELLSASGAVLAVLRFSYPCADMPDAAKLTFGPILPDENARGRGKVTEARISDASGAEVFRCDVSEIDRGAVVQLNSTDIVPGGVVSLRSFTLEL